MAKTDRDTVIAGNWKMYKTIEESVGYVQELVALVKGSARRVYLAVPFTAISAVAEAAAGSNIVVGAQNMNDAEEGAFTGEVAGRMLKDAGAAFVILGHSERRHVFGETNSFVNRKVLRALQDGLQPIVCFGETLQERDEGRTQEVLKRQLEETLSAVTKSQASSLILAYEPVWAIGTGHTATAEQADEAHKFLRGLVKGLWGDDVASQLVILYGGSVKPDNAGELLSCGDIDGLLVGGASLKPQIFSQIVNA